MKFPKIDTKLPEIGFDKLKKGLEDGFHQASANIKEKLGQKTNSLPQIDLSRYQDIQVEPRSIYKVLAGVAIGIGAVAAVPFTGGGSVLGGATLLASLAGAGTAATLAGVAGGVAGAIVGKKENDHLLAVKKNSFDEGYSSGELTTKSKFSSILQTQRERDEYLLISSYIIIYVARIDGCLHEEESKQLNQFLKLVQDSPVTPQVIKDRINNLFSEELYFENVKQYLTNFISNRDFDEKVKIIESLNDLIMQIILADGEHSSEELAFLDAWNQFIFTL